MSSLHTQVKCINKILIILMTDNTLIGHFVILFCDEKPVSPATY